MKLVNDVRSVLPPKDSPLRSAGFRDLPFRRTGTDGWTRGPVERPGGWVSRPALPGCRPSPRPPVGKLLGARWGPLAGQGSDKRAGHTPIRRPGGWLYGGAACKGLGWVKGPPRKEPLELQVRGSVGGQRVEPGAWGDGRLEKAAVGQAVTTGQRTYSNREDLAETDSGD